MTNIEPQATNGDGREFGRHLTPINGNPDVYVPPTEATSSDFPSYV